MEPFELLANETPTQAQFREDMQRAGFDLCLFNNWGKSTYAVLCSTRYANSAPHPSEVREATDLRLSRVGVALDEVLFP